MKDKVRRTFADVSKELKGRFKEDVVMMKMLSRMASGKWVDSFLDILREEIDSTDKFLVIKEIVTKVRIPRSRHKEIMDALESASAKSPVFREGLIYLMQRARAFRRISNPDHFNFCQMKKAKKKIKMVGSSRVEIEDEDDDLET